MKIYMSLWTNGIGFSNTSLNLWKLSLALANKHYTNVELITNSTGYELMKDLPFSNFHIQLNNVPNYPTIWCLGKIYAYQYACSLNEPFLHLDGDVLLWEPLPTDLINSPIFAQSYDYAIMEHNIYDIYKLQNDLGSPVPMEWTSNVHLKAFNMGIFGGLNISLINEYCDFVINMINNPAYHNLWAGLPGAVSLFKDDDFNSSNAKSCLIEQANLAIFCKNKGVVPSVLFEHKDDPNNVTYKKYTHLITKKNQPSILEKISERVSVEPYNLEPKNVSIAEWHQIR